jgi:hypothetical protein
MDCMETERPAPAHEQRTRGLIDGTIDEGSGLNIQQSDTSGRDNEYEDGRSACQPTAHYAKRPTTGPAPELTARYRCDERSMTVRVVMSRGSLGLAACGELSPVKNVIACWTRGVRHRYFLQAWSIQASSQERVIL